MRLQAEASPGTEEGWIDGLEAAGYFHSGLPEGPEVRYEHSGGSTVRIFPATKDRPSCILYAYPPGGTDHPRGPLHAFSPFKKHVQRINARHERDASEVAASLATFPADPADSEDSTQTADPTADEGENGDVREPYLDAGGAPTSDS